MLTSGERSSSLSSLKQSFLEAYISSFDTSGSKVSSLLNLQSQVFTHVPDEETIYSFIKGPISVLESAALGEVLTMINSDSADSRRRLAFADDDTTGDANDNDDEVSELLLDSFQLFSGEMVAGQYVSVYENDFYSYSYHAVLPRVKDYLFSSPLSLLQPASQSDYASLVISFDNVGSDTKLGAAAINQNAIQEVLNADIIQFMVHDPDLCRSSACGFDLMIPHYQDIPFNTTYVTEVSIYTRFIFVSPTYLVSF